jgi:hypothetical protein
MLRLASNLRERAIQVLKPHGAFWVSTEPLPLEPSGELAPVDIDPFIPELSQYFPDAPADAIRAALWSATTYLIR